MRSLGTRILARIRKAGVYVGERQFTNYIDTDSITWTITEDPTNDEIEISAEAAGGGGASDLDDLTDVVITSAASGDFLRHNGTNWVDATIAEGDIPAAIARDAEVAAAYQPLDSDLTAVAGLSPSNDDLLQRKAGAWTNRTPAQVKTDLAITGADVANTAAGNIAATTAQGAINELDAEKQPRAHPLRPAVALYETFPRHGSHLENRTVLSSGRLHMVAIDLPSGVEITSISFSSGTTALSSGNNQWFALYDQDRALLRQTADDGATAWAANTVKTLSLTSSFTTTYSGIHYLGIMVNASTVPSNITTGSASGGINALPPIPVGTSNTGLTTTAPNPANALSAQNSSVYGYVS